MKGLKPCPFCGGEGRHYVSSYNHVINCTSCDATTHHSLWNNRPAENKIKADAVREAHDVVLKALVKQYTTPDPHCFEVLGMLSLYADKVKEGDVE